MATFPKISDSEMNYFQFKARQMLLLKKENQEWQKLCKETAPECAACSAEKEKTDSSISKNIGIQVSPKKLFNKAAGVPVHSKYKKDVVPETLKDIKTKLENIDFALNKMYETSITKVKEQKCEMPLSTSINAQDMKLLEERRKYLIQKSLKDSLQRIEHYHSVLKKPQKSVIPIKKKNPGYFLPHDLQEKRTAARKIYLASLKNKPKVELPRNLQDKKKKMQNTEDEKHTSEKSKFRGKSIPKMKKTESSQTKVLTVLEPAESSETKDENIEYTVDGILDDLLGEAVLDLNRIKLQKGDRKSIQIDGDKNLTTNIINSTKIKSIPDELVNDSGKEKLKLFWNLPKELQDNKEIAVENKQGIVLNKMFKNISNEPGYGIQSSSKTAQEKNSYEIRNPPKFVCGVSHVVSIDPDKAKQISSNRERFWEYLNSISRTTKGDFNPWVICDMVAEAVLDDCIHDVSEELSDIPSTLIKELYNQEFMQQVDF